MISAKSTKLAPRGTIASQMEQIQRLRSADPESFAHRFALGNELVRSCASGAYRVVIDAVNGASDDDIFFYFAVKMFHTALINGHIMIANFLLDQGFPLQYAGTMGVPHPLTEAVAVVEEFRTIAIIEFLVIGKHMDINAQPPPNWLTPLHIAVKRGLLKTVKFLLTHGADPNAVAKDDTMPLTLAEALPAQHPGKEEIVDALLRKGAKCTWRTTTTGGGTAPTVFKSFSGGSGGTASSLTSGVGGSGIVLSTFNPPMQSTMVSFKGGGFTGTSGASGALITASSVTVEFTAGTSGNGDIDRLLSGSVVMTGAQMKTSFSAHESVSKPADATADGKFGVPSRTIGSAAADATSASRISSGATHGSTSVTVSTMVSSGATHSSTAATNSRTGATAASTILSCGATHSRASNGPKLTMSSSHQMGIVGGRLLSSINEDGSDAVKEDESSESDSSDLGFRLSDDGAFIFSTNS